MKTDVGVLTSQLDKDHYTRSEGRHDDACLATTRYNASRCDCDVRAHDYLGSTATTTDDAWMTTLEHDTAPFQKRTQGRLAAHPKNGT